MIYIELLKNKIKFVLIAFILCNFQTYSELKAQEALPFSSKNEQSGIGSNNNTSSFSESQGISYEYKPFDNNNQIPQSYSRSALKGPIGPPVNGLPVDNSLLLLICLAICYGIYKKWIHYLYQKLSSLFRSK